MPPIDESADDSQDRQPWYADGLAFQCTGCGNCCRGHGFVWVDDDEIAELAAFQQRAVGELRLLDTRPAQGKVTLREHPNGDCIYLDTYSMRCKVYEARPRQCRTWPFWRTNLTDEAAWKKAGRSCPGLNQGNLVPLSEIENRVQQTDL